MPSATSKPDRYGERSPSRSDPSSPSGAVIRRSSWPDRERELVTARKGSRTVRVAPPTGLEPVLPAPEADALSAELRGRSDPESRNRFPRTRRRSARPREYPPFMVSEVPRVLLVDDDAVILRLLEVNFRLEGFAVDTAGRGEQAIERATASPPEAVVCDVMLPGADGFEVC